MMIRILSINRNKNLQTERFSKAACCTLFHWPLLNSYYHDCFAFNHAKLDLFTYKRGEKILFLEKMYFITMRRTTIFPH